MGIPLQSPPFFGDQPAGTGRDEILPTNHNEKMDIFKRLLLLIRDAPHFPSYPVKSSSCGPNFFGMFFPPSHSSCSARSRSARLVYLVVKGFFLGGWWPKLPSLLRS